jgi:transcriptional regulator with XRE-family HTH domain
MENRKTDKDFLELVGINIKNRRKQLRLTCKQLSEKTGILPSNISVIEHGRSNPQLLTFLILAKGLNTTVKKFFEIPFNYDDYKVTEKVYEPYSNRRKRKKKDDE